MEFKYVCREESAPKIWDWLNHRGGILVWKSINLSNPEGSWTTPTQDPDGKRTEKPTWEAGPDPELITDLAEVGVSVDQEVKRFHVAVRLGSQGFMLKCTDASSRRIRREVERAGEGSYYLFDKGTQEAVIYAPTGPYVCIGEWAAGKDWKDGAA